MKFEELEAKINEVLGEDVEGKAGLAVLEIFRAVTEERDDKITEAETQAVEIAAHAAALKKIGESVGVAAKEEGLPREEIIAAVQEAVDKAGRRLSAKTLAALKALVGTLGKAQEQITGLLDEESKETEPGEQKSDDPAEGEEEPSGEGSTEELDPEEKAAAELLESDALKKLREAILGNTGE